MESSFLNAAGTIGRVTISERIEAGRRERAGPGPGLACRVAAGAGRAGTDAGAGLGPAEGISIRTLAAAAGLSPSRVHQLVAGAGLDALDAALAELRAASWPAPEDPDPGRTPIPAGGTP
jgi:hypothetical protein